MGVLQALPIVTGCWGALTAICSYALSTSLEHTLPVWPYLSDTGTLPPTSGLFSCALNVFALLAMAIAFGKLQQVRACRRSFAPSGAVDVLNVGSFASAAVAIVGIFLVANFQVSLVPTVHGVGATLALLGGCVYIITQAALTWTPRRGSSLRSLPLAIGRSLGALVGAVASLTSAGCFICRYGATGDIDFPIRLSQGEAGFECHLCSAFAEWIAVATITATLVSFHKDFVHVKCTSLKVEKVE